jgi:fibrillarin-like pre-rRNA processing protein
MNVKEIFDGVFRINGKLATRNLVRGARVYDEELVEADGEEYRLWNPYRSKLAAAMLNGMKHMSIKEGSKVLYLGAATGTTSSHVSDIVGDAGVVYCVEISERSMRELVKVCEMRQNMLPLLLDARNVDLYAGDIEPCDALYQDIAARDQSDILKRNARLLKSRGAAYVAIKSQSIDVAKDPEEVYKAFLKDISDTFDVLEKIDIAPYSKMHLFVVLRKKT